MIIKKIKQVDKEFLEPAMQETLGVDWDSVYDLRSSNPVFAKCKTIHLRVASPSSAPPKPTEISKWSAILDIVDRVGECNKYPAVYKCVEWILKEVNGISLGRIMIVNMLPNSMIGIHRDPGQFPYFSKFSRFHIPLITNEDVVFVDGSGAKEHMESGNLYQLNNLGPHGVENYGNNARVHIIADIEVAGGNKEF